MDRFVIQSFGRTCGWFFAVSQLEKSVPSLELYLRIQGAVKTKQVKAFEIFDNSCKSSWKVWRISGVNCTYFTSVAKNRFDAAHKERKGQRGGPETSVKKVPGDKESTAASRGVR